MLLLLKEDNVVKCFHTSNTFLKVFLSFQEVVNKLRHTDWTRIERIVTIKQKT